jgi:hypothetical protein
MQHVYHNLMDLELGVALEDGQKVAQDHRRVMDSQEEADLYKIHVKVEQDVQDRRPWS